MMNQSIYGSEMCWAQETNGVESPMDIFLYWLVEEGFL